MGTKVPYNDCVQDVLHRWCTAAVVHLCSTTVTGAKVMWTRGLLLFCVASWKNQTELKSLLPTCHLCVLWPLTLLDHNDSSWVFWDIMDASPASFWFHSLSSSGSCGKCHLNSISLGTLCATSKKQALICFFPCILVLCILHWINKKANVSIWSVSPINILGTRDQGQVFLCEHAQMIHFFILEWDYPQLKCKPNESCGEK